LTLDMPRNFSLTLLFGATLAVALFAGAWTWVARMLSIDPSTEQVTILGQPANLNWTPATWEPNPAGWTIPAVSITPAAGWAGARQVDIWQPLISIAYRDQLGNEAYQASLYAIGSRNQDWSDYMVEIVGMDFEDSRGSTRADFSYNPATRTLRLDITQYLNHSRIAKSAAVAFRCDGDEFSRR
jgi:hypothetical protein